MPERYPQDAILLTLTQDDQTGVEYIPTGKTPYFLEFRRLLQRTLLAAQRANDLRPYQEGDWTLGIRPGRCFIRNTPRDFAGVTGLTVAADAVTRFWLDAEGLLQTGASFPSDRTAFLPLAEVVAGHDGIDSLIDLRGQTFLCVPDPVMLGLTTQVQAIHPGPVSASVTGQLMGVVPVSGVVTDVVLSLGNNIDSSIPQDGLSATAKVNGVTLTSTDPAITCAAGPGFRSTARGDGTAAVVKTNGVQFVRRGDVLSVDLTRTAAGTIAADAAEAVVLIVIRVAQV